MNNHQTIEKLKGMRLHAMATLHHEHLRDNRITSMTTDEYLALLTDHEWEDRWHRKIERLTKQAKFRQKASLAEVDYTHVRNLEKNMFVRLGALGVVGFIDVLDVALALFLGDRVTNIVDIEAQGFGQIVEALELEARQRFDHQSLSLDTG